MLPRLRSRLQTEQDAERAAVLAAKTKLEEQDREYARRLQVELCFVGNLCSLPIHVGICQEHEQVRHVEHTVHPGTCLNHSHNTVHVHF